MYLRRGIRRYRAASRPRWRGRVFSAADGLPVVCPFRKSLREIAWRVAFEAQASA